MDKIKTQKELDKYQEENVNNPLTSDELMFIQLNYATRIIN